MELRVLRCLGCNQVNLIVPESSKDNEGKDDACVRCGTVGQFDIVGEVAVEPARVSGGANI